VLKEIISTLKQPDPHFYLYQYPSYLETGHELVEQFAGDGYMGLRQAWKHIDPSDIEGKVVCEIGCNIGATSCELMALNPQKLFSYDYSYNAIEICGIVRRHLKLVNWHPWCCKFECSLGIYDTIIWEDPHTADDGETKSILTQVYDRARVIYFLECDNIYHLIEDKNLEQLSENSWKLVL
jgi:predicted RNA methylase